MLVGMAIGFCVSGLTAAPAAAFTLGESAATLGTAEAVAGAGTPNAAGTRTSVERGLRKASSRSGSGWVAGDERFGSGKGGRTSGWATADSSGRGGRQSGKGWVSATGSKGGGWASASSTKGGGWAKGGEPGRGRKRR